MKYGRALDRLNGEVVIVDSSLVPLYVLKDDINDGFYCLPLSPVGMPKLGLVFPSADNIDDLVALPLILPMVWNNSPPILCTATVMAAYLENSDLNYNQPSFTHKLDSGIYVVVIP